MHLLSTTHHATLVIAVLASFVLWRVYSRVRRLVGRQPSRLWRHRGTVLVVPPLLGLLALGSLDQPKSLFALGGGMVIGILLAVVGVRLSRFEVTEEGPFYTPYAPIGIGLSALLVTRLAYRVTQIAELHLTSAGGLHELSATPTTLLVFGTLASYYAAYAVGLLRWRRRLAAAAKTS